MYVAIIPAKGDSTRLLNKNTLKINGKTLIEYAVNYAKSSERISDIYVSTDKEEIVTEAKALGAKVIRRGSELGGETPLYSVFRHAIQQIGDNRITHVVGIQPDHPDRRINLSEVIDYCIQKNVDVFFTVDKQGRRNGSLQILSRKALTTDQVLYSATLMDDCTNIHTSLDFHLAAQRLSPYAQRILAGNRWIGREEPAFIVAEAACNHMCRMDLARAMVEKAALAGADSIKFQTYKAERLVTDEAVAFWGSETIKQVDYYRRLDRFGEKEYAELFALAKEKGIIGFSSPFDEDNAHMLNDLGMPIFKIASCEVPNLRFLRLVAGFNKPVILSTGASSVEEIDRAVEAILSTGNHQLILLACTLSYPTPYADANFLRIRTLIDRFPGLTIGISDHTEPDPHMAVPAAAVALGARVVEKHYTLDRSMTGSGHFFSVDPEALKKMVANIRLIETILGMGNLGVAAAEEKAWKNARRSIVAERAIRKGETITADMLGTKRPGCGMDASRLDEVIGKRAKADIAKDQRILPELIGL